MLTTTNLYGTEAHLYEWFGFFHGPKPKPVVVEDDDDDIFDDSDEDEY